MMNHHGKCNEQEWKKRLGRLGMHNYIKVIDQDFDATVPKRCPNGHRISSTFQTS